MMRTFSLVAAAALCGAALAGSAFAQPAADPIAPARNGQLQCYVPNLANKTCASIAGYVVAADGTIDNVADTAINPQPLIVMRTHSPVVIRNGAVCGAIQRGDVERAEFTIAGQPASAEQTQQFRTALVQQMSAILGVDICTTYTPVEGGLRADASFNGTPRPELSQTVTWVRPEDGYTVAP